MSKTFIKAGLFTMALAATGAFAEGTYDPNQPDSRYQVPQTTEYSSVPASSDIRNADSAIWGVGG
jgi:hypothetical protein